MNGGAAGCSPSYNAANGVLRGNCSHCIGVLITIMVVNGGGCRARNQPRSPLYFGVTSPLPPCHVPGAHLAVSPLAGAHGHRLRCPPPGLIPLPYSSDLSPRTPPPLPHRTHKHAQPRSYRYTLIGRSVPAAQRSLDAPPTWHTDPARGLVKMAKSLPPANASSAPLPLTTARRKTWRGRGEESSPY